MLYIIQIDPEEGTDFHPYEGQTGQSACWREGYIVVPQALMEQVRKHCLSCMLTIEDGVLTGIVPVEPAEEPEEMITQEQALMLLLGGG